MTKSIFQSQFLVIFVLIGCSISSLNAEIRINRPVYKEKPSNVYTGREVFFSKKYKCVSAKTGEAIPCQVDSKIIGFSSDTDMSNIMPNLPEINCNSMAGVNIGDLINSGGHYDSIANTDFIFPGTDYLLNNIPGDTYLEVSGKTLEEVFTLAELTYKTSEYSRVLEIVTRLISAPGYTFSNGEFYEFSIERHFIRETESLSRMEGCVNEHQVPGQPYELVRSPGDISNHPEAHWGKSYAITKAIKIAKIINTKNSVLLPYNDMSLIVGGRHESHDTHRIGTGIDINKSKINYDCSDPKQVYILNAVRDVAGKYALPKLVCETNNHNNLHVNF